MYSVLHLAGLVNRKSGRSRKKTDILVYIMQSEMLQLEQHIRLSEAKTYIFML